MRLILFLLRLNMCQSFFAKELLIREGVIEVCMRFSCPPRIMSPMMKFANAVLILASIFSFVAADFQGDALFALRTSLNASPTQLPDWNQNQVNPCTWSNVNCDPDYNVVMLTLSSIGFSGYLSPKIGVLKTLTTLTLRGNNITGEIPKEIGDLSSLVRLDLENNLLTGDIPSSLGNLKKLQFLDLSQNHLSGSIPESIANLPSLINLQLSSNDLSGQLPDPLFRVSQYNFTGNKFDCGRSFPRSCASNNNDAGTSNKSKLGTVIGVVGGVLGFFLLGGVIFLLWKGRRKKYRQEVFVDVAGVQVQGSSKLRNVVKPPPKTNNTWLEQEEGEDDRRIAFGQLKRFAWRELQLATDSFSEKNVLGQGGFGKVYKGVLGDNTKIAVKRLTDYESPGGEQAFLREVEMISVAVHKNLLRLIGFCTTPSERLLVYPFMQNLSVAYCIREVKPGQPVLGWPTRKRVAVGTARGLEYLHEHCNPKIIHRDVKAANVLLDENFEAVVGDFGLAKLVDVRTTNVTTQVRGTMGHIAPEYLSTGKSSERTDVFGYGVMLLELVTGQRAIDFSRLEEEDDVLLLDHGLMEGMRVTLEENQRVTIGNEIRNPKFIGDENHRLCDVWARSNRRFFERCVRRAGSDARIGKGP
ncbi:hypothetical protein GIB67_013870 [Kingdonia uniflora]|uniref:non-specific serine/threonine protein kinase n=1 Tax=Kingdonia uniflora TaxID=39325 RepID=A0A7J7LD74_9MAGN|nr:hypothetical protein GIB67_013870 [Kingdonia uniflora]